MRPLRDIKEVCTPSTLRLLLCLLIASQVVAAILLQGLFALVRETFSMFQPYFYAILWAILLGEVLDGPRVVLLEWVQEAKRFSAFLLFKKFISSAQAPWLFAAVVACGALLFWRSFALAVIAGALLYILLQLAFFMMHERTLVAVGLLAGLCVLGTVMLGILAYEVNMAVWMIKEKVENLTLVQSPGVLERQYVRDFLQIGIERIEQHVNTTQWGPVLAELKVLARGELSEWNQLVEAVPNLWAALSQFDIRLVVGQGMAATNMIGHFSGNILAGLFFVVSTLTDVSATALVFVSCLFYILSSPQPPLRSALPALKSYVDVAKMENQFEGLLRDVFIIPFSSAAWSALGSFAMVWCAGLEFPWFTALVVFGLSLVPFVSVWFVGAVWALVLAYRGEFAFLCIEMGFFTVVIQSPIQDLFLPKAIVGVLWAFMLANRGDLLRLLVGLLFFAIVELKAWQPAARDPKLSYVTSLSVVMGIAYFGVQGAFFGPLLVCGCVVVYRLGNDIRQQLEQQDNPPT